MSILTWIEDKKRLKVLNAPKHFSNSTDSSKGLWTRCDKCGVILYIKHLKENQRVCFSCSYHLQMMSGERIENLLDKGEPITFGVGHANALPLLKKSALRDAKANTSNLSTWRPLDETVSPCDPLKFHDQKAYTDRLQDAQERTGLQDAIQTGTGMIDGIPVALAVMDFSFMGGSMGSVVGEKITRLIEYATGEGLTLLIVSASGGARMQEGVFSLMQMAKISSALQIYQSCAKLLYISILTSPTTGGVTASFAMLGDIIFAEPKALIAFAGRRVIEQTLCEDLPDDFQTSEYMLHHGLVDLIVPRRFLRQALSETIRLYQNAPFKKRGQIPFGVQNPITFLTEEKIRRGWSGLTSPGAKASSSKESNTSHFRTNQNFNGVGEVITSGFTGSDGHSDTSKLFKAKPKRTYREILTSFEIMLALFVSGNTKKQNKTSLRLQKTTNLKPLEDYSSSKIKAQTLSQTFVEEKQLPSTFTKGITSDEKSAKAFANQKQTKSFFWLYNNLILRASNRFYNKKFSSDQFISAQYRKNQPLYFILKNDFVSYTKQGFNRKEGIALTKSLPTVFKSKRPSQNLTNSHKKADSLNGVYLQKTRFAWKNENGNVPIVESRSKKASASLKENPLFLQKDGFLVSKSQEHWSFSKLLGVAFTKPCLFLFSRKNCKSLLSKRFLASMKHANLNKSLGKNRLGVQRSLLLQNGAKKSFARKPVGFSTFFETGLDKSLIRNVSKKNDISKNLTQTTPLLKNKQAKPSIRLKQSFVQQVLFDFGFYCSSGIYSSKKTHEKSTFVRQAAKMKPLRDTRQSEGQTSSSMKATANSSLYVDKKREQNSALIYGDMPSSSLLYNFRRLAEVTLESNGLQTFNVQKSVGQDEPSDFSERHTEQKTQALQKRAFYKGQNQIDLIADLNDTRFNRSAIGFKQTNYLFERAFYFLQNKKQSLITRKSNNKVSGLFPLSSGFSGNLRDLSSVFLISGSYFDNAKQKQSFKEPIFANQTTNLNKSPYTAKNLSVTTFTSAENDIDFLNQAIELAATESVEWRAFYIHQQLSENTGFVDEFLQQESFSKTASLESWFENSSGSEPKMSGNDISSVSRKQIGNVLFYKSLCRSKNLFSS